MNLHAIIIFLFFGTNLFGQNRSIIYRNNTNAYYSSSSKKSAFYEPKINEIILNSDSTFEFWSRPNVSCFTWNEYKGTWKTNYDTISFYNTYEIFENDTKTTFKNDSKRTYRINFKTDKNSDLRNTRINVKYVYDFDAHLEDFDKEFKLTKNELLEIPFDDIPNLDKLAAIRIQCQLNNIGKRDSYLTENNFVNKRQHDIPNIISVEFLENPKTEIVQRSIKGVIKNDKLVIVSTSKTQTILPDFNREIIFEDNYKLEK